MSLIKAEDSDCENNERGEITGTKCGEIFTTESEIFNVLCTFCRTILEDIDEFKVHFQTNHNNQFEDDVEIKIEELPNDDTLVDPIGQCMDAEDCIEALEFASIVNLESIIEQNVDNQTLIKIGDGNSLKEYISDNLSKKSEKKSNSSDNPQNKKRRYIPKLHVCDICNKAFNNTSTLKNHKIYDHTPTYSFVNILNNQSNSPDENQEQDRLHIDPAQSIENDPFKCRYCDSRFKGRLYRFEHECLHTGERPFKCTICEKTFRVEIILKRHLRTHENKKEFKCDICSKSYNARSSLRKHIHGHNNYKPHKCSYCDKRFVYPKEKEVHERIHTGEKPYQCNVCGNQFPSGSKLGFHFRSKHTPQTPIKCENCDKTFMSKERLKGHQVVHNKDYRPYKCDVCDATFQRWYAFSEHKKLHSDVLHYTCNICGKGFKQFAGLYSHKKSHGENLSFQKTGS